MTLYYPPTQNGLQKNLDAQLDQGETSQMTLNNTTGIQNKPGVVVVDRIDTSGNEKSSTVREYISYTGVSGNNLTGLTRGLAGSTDQDHAIGAIVEFIPDVTVFQGLIDTITAEHNESGTHDTTKVVDLTTAQTLTNKTISNPLVSDVYDNGNLTGSVNIDASNGTRQKGTLTGNVTITLVNPVEGRALELFLFQDSTGGRTISFDTTITWQDNTTPTWTTTANKLNSIVLRYVNSAWFGVGAKFD